MKKRQASNIFRLFLGIIIPLFFVCLGINFVYASGDGETITASVTIIDPRGPYAVIVAIPEKRIPNVSEDRVQNKGALVNLKVFPAGADRSNPDNALINITTSTSDGGIIGYNVFEGLSQGTYDFTIKGYSHLTRLLSNVLVGYFVSLNFTNNDVNPLLAGDINGEMGDDMVNALDMSLLVNTWNTDNDKSDLNQDFLVNSLDMSNLLDNYNLVGD